MRIAICVAQVTHTEAILLQQPVETLYTGTILKAIGHSVEVLDLRLGQGLSQSEHEPDVAFLLTETYDRSQCFSLNLGGARHAVRTLRNAWPRVPIITVGVHATLEPDITSRTLSTEMVLGGEIEVGIPWLVDQCAREPGLLANLPPIAAAPRLTDVGSLPAPDYSLIDVSLYRSEVVRTNPHRVSIAKSGLVFANRGCPYTCDYCFVWPGKKLRYRPVSLVIEELQRQVELGVRDFFFLDYTFTLDRNWVQEFCTAMRRAELDVNWVCQTRCERVDLELLTMMESAGCRGVWYGIESPWIADAHRHKPISLPTIQRAIDWTNAAGIQCFLFIILGLGSSHRARESGLVDWLTQVPALFFAQPLIPRPGTGLWMKHLDKHTQFDTWQEVYHASRSIAERFYWYPEMDRLQQELAALSNNVDNLPVEETA